MFQLVNQTQDYAWGSPTAIPEILGSPGTSAPVAELWMGAHPSAPSCAVTELGDVPLDELVAADPERLLGTDVVARFGPCLPYLLKVLAAATPLSLQVHPRIDQARAGFDAEEAAGIALTRPERNYKDRNHKPEVIRALTPLEALCGFRTPGEAAQRVAGLGAPLAKDLHAILTSTTDDAVEIAVRHLLGSPRPSADQVDAVADACRVRLEAGSPDPEADRLVVRLADVYPGDPGVVASLLLNHVTLAPGEAMFVPAGSVHAYVHGVAVEVMANSDNVLRAGLTSKHKDTAELLATIDYTPAPPRRISPEVSGATAVFRAPVDDFVLSFTTVDDDGEHRCPGSGPRIVFCLEGQVNLRVAAGQTGVLTRGDSVFVPASDGALTLTGRGVVAQADVP